MGVSTWADLLTEYRASAIREELDDFRPPEVIELIPEFVCYGRKLKSSEKQAAGVEAAVISYALYADMPLHPELTEAIELQLAQADGTGLGTYNVRSVVPYEPEGLALLEVDRLSTA